MRSKSSKRLAPNPLGTFFGLCFFSLFAAEVSATPFQLAVPDYAKGSIIDQSACVKRLRLVLSSLGYELELQFTPSLRALQQASSGQIDGDLARSSLIETQYTNLRRVAMPCASMQPALYALKHQPAPRTPFDHEPDLIQTSGGDAIAGDSVSNDADRRETTISKPMTWKQRRLKKIAYFRGSSRLIGSLAGTLNDYDLVYTDSGEQSMKLLQAQRVDAVFLSKVLFNQLEQSSPELVWDVAQLTPELDDVQLYTYLHKRHEGLIVQLDKLMGASGLPAGQ